MWPHVFVSFNGFVIVRSYLPQPNCWHDSCRPGRLSTMSGSNRRFKIGSLAHYHCVNGANGPLGLRPSHPVDPASREHDACSSNQLLLTTLTVWTTIGTRTQDLRGKTLRKLPGALPFSYSRLFGHLRYGEAALWDFSVHLQLPPCSQTGTFCRNDLVSKAGIEPATSCL